MSLQWPTYECWIADLAGKVEALENQCDRFDVSYGMRGLAANKYLI